MNNTKRSVSDTRDRGGGHGMLEAGKSGPSGPYIHFTY